MGWSRGPVGERLGRLLLTTVAMTYVLVLLGIYTAAEGAGLTCAGRWPLCDGAVFGLFPANWPSFVEWFHRLVAMLTGLLIITCAIATWRGRTPRRVVLAVGTAALVLPLQIWAGAQTVLTYEIVVLTAHFLIALVIYTALLTGTIWGVAPRALTRRELEVWLAGGFLLTIPFVALGPRILFIHTGRVQVGYYGLGLLLWTVVLAALVLLPRTSGIGTSERRWIGIGLGATIGALAGKLLAGRLVSTGTVQLIDWAGAAVLLVGLGATIALVHHGREATWGSGRAGPSDAGMSDSEQ